MSRSSGLSSAPAGGAPSGSSAIPQIGQGPGFVSRTSGSMGQTQIVPVGAALAAAFAFVRAVPEIQPSGSVENFAAQPVLQNQKVFPPCSRFAAAVAGSTVIPQIGSIAGSGLLTNGIGRMGEIMQGPSLGTRGTVPSHR